MYNNKEYCTVKEIGIDNFSRKVCEVKFKPTGETFQLVDNNWTDLPNGLKIHSVLFKKNTAPADPHLIADIREITRKFFEKGNTS